MIRHHEHYFDDDFARIEAAPETFYERHGIDRDD